MCRVLCGVLLVNCMCLTKVGGSRERRGVGVFVAKKRGLLLCHAFKNILNQIQPFSKQKILNFHLKIGDFSSSKVVESWVVV